MTSPAAQSENMGKLESLPYSGAALFIVSPASPRESPSLG
jgi:hypothetical protein